MTSLPYDLLRFVTVSTVHLYSVYFCPVISLLELGAKDNARVSGFSYSELPLQIVIDLLEVIKEGVVFFSFQGFLKPARTMPAFSALSRVVGLSSTIAQQSPRAPIYHDLNGLRQKGADVFFSHSSVAFKVPFSRWLAIMI